MESVEKPPYTFALPPPSLHLFYNFEQQNHPYTNLFTTSRPSLPHCVRQDQLERQGQFLATATMEMKERSSDPSGISQLASFSPSLAPILVLVIVSEYPN